MSNNKTNFVTPMNQRQLAKDKVIKCLLRYGTDRNAAQIKKERYDEFAAAVRSYGYDNESTIRCVINEAFRDNKLNRKRDVQRKRLYQFEDDILAAYLPHFMTVRKSLTELASEAKNICNLFGTEPPRVVEHIGANSNCNATKDTIKLLPCHQNIMVLYHELTHYFNMKNIAIGWGHDEGFVATYFAALSYRISNHPKTLLDVLSLSTVQCDEHQLMHIHDKLIIRAHSYGKNYTPICPRT